MYLLLLNEYNLTSNFKELHEVVELTMDISAHSDRTVDSLLEKHKFIQCFVGNSFSQLTEFHLYIALFRQDLLGFLTEHFHLKAYDR